MLQKIKEIEKKINELDNQISEICKKDYHCVATSKEECIELLTDSLNDFKTRFSQPNSEILLDQLINDINLEIKSNQLLCQ